MREVGQLSLLMAFVCSGYGAFACVTGGLHGRRSLSRIGVYATVLSVAGLVVCLAILAQALIVKDFRFAYVAQYSSRLLPWQYSLSALWVGQAGSLLLWAGIQGALCFGLLWGPRRTDDQTRTTAFGLATGFTCFLVGVMVFGADPMQRNLDVAGDGAGLSPLLQHPSMLIHPPVVFLGYALWTIPAALAASVLLRHPRQLAAAQSSAVLGLNTEWIEAARPWALLGWSVLGSGILLGAEWSYEELGWGGYWAWDPVENGSFIPWLTGTAFIHGLMAWRFRGVLKKVTLALGIATFGLCNFATFLTRSGIFSSLHAFSESPIGWMFLGLMIACTAGIGALVFQNRRFLRPDHKIAAFWSRESQIVMSSWALLLLAAAVFLGTISIALSELVIGRRVVLSEAYYNSVMIPVSLLLLASLGMAPLLNWGRNPTAKQRTLLQFGVAPALLTMGGAWMFGAQQFVGLLLAGMAGFVVYMLAAAVRTDRQRIAPGGFRFPTFAALRARRRQYSGYLVHVGVLCLAIGVTGSSLGTQRQELILQPGKSVTWSNYSIEFVRLHEFEHPDKFVAEAELRITPLRRRAFTVRPAQHLHHLQSEWTSEVGIHSTLAGDFYAILHNGEPGEAVRVTLVENPLICWLWIGGAVMVVGSLAALWPAKQVRSLDSRRGQVSSAPKFLSSPTQPRVVESIREGRP